MSQTEPHAPNWLGDPDYRRVPLTTNQHILYLLLTVFTCGLFLPIWVILAIRGEREYIGPPLPSRKDHR